MSPWNTELLAQLPGEIRLLWMILDELYRKSLLPVTAIARLLDSDWYPVHQTYRAQQVGIRVSLTYLR